MSNLKFGPWTWNRKNDVLTHSTDKTYEIDFATIKTKREALDWIMHIAEKPSMGEPESLGHFVLALIERRKLHY